MKKFFSAILLMTMMVFSVGTFVSCNDLVNEIEDVKGQAGELQTAIAELEGEIASLETALQNAKAEAAAAAKTAADAAAKAQETGDAAAKAAKDAAAVAAAAQASAEAIEAQLADAKAALQAALDGKADKADVEAAVKEIEALKAALAGKADATDVEALKKTVELLQATLDEYKATLEELGLVDQALKDAYATLDARLEKTLSDMQAKDEANAEAVADLKKLVEKLNGNLTGFTQTIKDLVNRIQSIVYVPETSDGMMTAYRYFQGEFNSDYYVRATFEVTPKDLVAEINDANVYFKTVDVKAAPAEIINAKVIGKDAATGRIEVLATIKDNDANKVTYAELKRWSENFTNIYDNQNNYVGDGYIGRKGHVSFALNVVNDKEAVMLPDSTLVEADVHVSSSYVPACGNSHWLPGVASNYNVEKGEWVYSAYDEPVLVKYDDLTAKTPLAKYDLRFDIVGTPMTAAEAAAFLGTEIKVERPKDVVNYTVIYKDAVQNITDAKQLPFAVKPANYATTVALVTPADPKNVSLKDYINSEVEIVVPSGVKVNGDGAYSVGNIVATVKIDYASAADIDFGSFDAGKWSYEYYVSNQHRYYNPDLSREYTIKTPSKLENYTYNGTPLKDGYGMWVNLKAEYTDATGKHEEWGHAWFTVLSSNAVRLDEIYLPIVEQALTYNAVDFDLIDKDNVKYSAGFTATVGARPADKEISLGDLTYSGTIKTGFTKAVAPLAEALKVDGSFYADLLAEKTVYDLVNAGIGTADQDSKATAALVDVMYAGNPVAETSKIKVDAVSAYGTKYTVKTTIPFYGVEYTFVGSVTVNKPNYAIKNSTLLINPSTGIGDILGDVKYPSKSGNTVTPGSAFVLNQIDLRDYVVITNDGANAAESLLNSGEFKLKYELISKYDHDNDPTNEMVLYPGVTFDGGKTATTLESALNATNVVAWDKTDSEFTTAKFRVTLVANNGALVETPYGYVADNFGSTEFTLQIPDLVAMSTTSKVPVEEFVPGSTGVKINVIENLKITDFNGKSLIGAKAKDLGTLWDLTAGGAEYKLYNQDVVVLEEPGIAPTAVVESTGDTLYYGTDFTVDANGDVNLLLTDLNIQSSVVVSVPLKLTHVYKDASDATNMVVAKVKFTPVK